MEPGRKVSPEFHDLIERPSVSCEVVIISVEAYYGANNKFILLRKPYKRNSSVSLQRTLLYVDAMITGLMPPLEYVVRFRLRITVKTTS